MFSWLKKKLRSSEKNSCSRRGASQFLDIGFHGDRYLLQLVEALAKESNVFIETGTNVGSTLAYFARKYPATKCFSCEPDDSAYSLARENTEKLENVSLFHGTSQQFIENILANENWVFSEQCLFWLDAHGYGFEWPLNQEIEFITTRFESGFILIDDFKVPGQQQFGYDTYQDQICSYDFIKDSINPAKSSQLYYPTYSDQTSMHHPLRGWGLLVMERDDFRIPESLAGRIEHSN